MDQQVTLESVSDDTYSYTFETPVETADLGWLKSNRYIQTYAVKGNVLTITKGDGTDWQSLNNDFVVPGLKKTFGELKVNMPATSRR